MLICFILMTGIVYADIVKTSSTNPQIQEKLNSEKQKIKQNKSAGYMFLKNSFKNNPDIKSMQIKEVYTSKISKEWTGGIFSVQLNLLNGKTTNQTVKLFYNKELIVEDIFTKNGESLSKYLTLPLIEPLKIYTEQFQINKRDKNKTSSYGINMVIFSDVLCPYCKQNMSSLLDFGKKHNMNIFLLDIALPKHPNSSTLAVIMHTAITLNPNQAMNIIKNTYSTNFPSTKSSTDIILSIFNKNSGVPPISIEDIKRQRKTELLNRSEEIARREYIKGTPTVFVDEKKFNIQIALKDR